jgi:hypothetical protein
MRVLPRYVRHAKSVMKYMEKNKTARTIDLVNLGIDNSYLSGFIPTLIEGEYLSRKRENGGYTYTFLKPLNSDNEAREVHEMQAFFHGFVTKSLKAHE